MTILRKGSTGNDVKRLQGLLMVYQDGVFGPITEESVKAFQNEHGLFPDGIVGEKTWAVLEPKGIILKRSRRLIDLILVHCTATPDGKDYTVDQIREWHKDRGFADIGYHYVIDLDGKQVTAAFNYRTDSLLQHDIKESMPADTLRMMEMQTKSIVQQYMQRMNTNQLIVR